MKSWYIEIICGGLRMWLCGTNTTASCPRLARKLWDTLAKKKEKYQEYNNNFYKYDDLNIDSASTLLKKNYSS